MSRIRSAAEDLKVINKTLERLEAHGVGLADAAQGLRRVSNVLGVALQELEAHEARLKALDDDLGDHLLAHEGWQPSKQEWVEYLATSKEERKKEAET